MKLAHIRVRMFRNIRDARVDPGPDVCVLYGANAQGKTNFLEALFVLSNLQSFRTHRVRDLLPLEGGSSILEAEVESRLGTTRVRLVVNSEGKHPKVNGKPPNTTSDYLAEIPTVVFSPQDLSLAKGSQDLRRRYLDRATFLADANHLTSLRNYNRALRQRNAALRRSIGEVEVWNRQVAHYGAMVYRGRRRTLEELHATIVEIHDEIAGRGEDIQLENRPDHGDLDVEEVLLERLQETEERDLRLGHTTTGPHRDTIRIRLDGRNVEEHASQGQLRTLALGLKLALLRWGREVRGESPIFLLDDPGSELDQQRLSALGEFLSSWNGQVIVTATQRDAVPLPSRAQPHYYRVESGVLHAE